jgi:hypothetical protein
LQAFSQPFRQFAAAAQVVAESFQARAPVEHKLLALYPLQRQIQRQHPVAALQRGRQCECVEFRTGFIECLVLVIEIDREAGQEISLLCQGRG